MKQKIGDWVKRFAYALLMICGSALLAIILVAAVVVIELTYLFSGKELKLNDPIAILKRIKNRAYEAFRKN